MELIVASLEGRLQNREQEPALIDRFRRHFMNSFAAHRDTAAYWAGIEDAGGGHFALTPLMRRLWEAHHNEKDA